MLRRPGEAAAAMPHSNVLQSTLLHRHLRQIRARGTAAGKSVEGCLTSACNV